jgi:uncharacterized protein YjiS (DUF1127 family)
MVALPESHYQNRVAPSSRWSGVIRLWRQWRIAKNRRATLHLLQNMDEAAVDDIGMQGVLHDPEHRAVS